MWKTSRDEAACYPEWDHIHTNTGRYKDFQIVVQKSSAFHIYAKNCLLFWKEVWRE